jgi:integrase
LSSNLNGPTLLINFQEELRLYLNTLNYGKRWLYIQNLILSKFLAENDNKIDKQRTIDYLAGLRKTQNNNYYRKNLLIIKGFLKYLAESVNPIFEFYKVLKVPKENHGTPKHFTMEELNAEIESFKGNKFYLQIKAALLLGAFSGCRAEELYQLKQEDIDLENRILYIRNDNEHSTKTGKSRITFFTKRVQNALIEYFEWRKHTRTGLSDLFGQSHLTRLLRNAPIKAHDLRHLFSSEACRRGLNFEIKELLLGHSIRKSTDLSHYLSLNEQELKKAYDTAFLQDGKMINEV